MPLAAKCRVMPAVVSSWVVLYRKQCRLNWCGRSGLVGYLHSLSYGHVHLDAEL